MHINNTDRLLSPASKVNLLRIYYNTDCFQEHDPPLQFGSWLQWDDLWLQSKSKQKCLKGTLHMQVYNVSFQQDVAALSRPFIFLRQFGVSFGHVLDSLVLEMLPLGLIGEQRGQV